MKYLPNYTQITFLEVPNEITLCISFTNCPFKCDGCHSPELREDSGEEFNTEVLEKLIKSSCGITCVCFMGGDKVPSEIDKYVKKVKEMGLLTCWYSGRDYISKHISIQNFDYLKIGHYDKEKGGLSSPTTNQVFYKVVTSLTDFGITNQLIDITNQFIK